jgi:eukaryotic-like serine/threonine-protein kinase
MNPSIQKYSRMKDTFKFLFSLTFLKHLGLALFIAIALLFLVFFSLGLYTLHGRTMPVPDLVGLTEGQFDNLVVDLDLRYQIIDSVHLNNVTPGAVVEQTPRASSQVKKGRTIFLTINALSPEMILAPRLIDYSVRNAVSIIESYGLKVGRLVYVPSEYANLVVGQHFGGKPLEPGSPLQKGSSIDLLVGQGLGNERTLVPDVMGLTLEEATGYLTGLSLNMGTVATDTSVVTAADSAVAVIWKQSPAYNGSQTLQLGASVDVWISKWPRLTDSE